MARLDEDNRKIDLNPSKRAYAIEFFEFCYGTEVQRSGEIPVVMNVLGFSQELILDSSLARAANWKLFSSHHDRFVRKTVPA